MTIGCASEQIGCSGEARLFTALPQRSPLRLFIQSGSVGEKMWTNKF